MAVPLKRFNQIIFFAKGIYWWPNNQDVTRCENPLREPTILNNYKLTTWRKDFASQHIQYVVMVRCCRFWHLKLVQPIPRNQRVFNNWSYLWTGSWPYWACDIIKTACPTCLALLNTLLPISIIKWARDGNELVCLSLTVLDWYHLFFHTTWVYVLRNFYLDLLSVGYRCMRILIFF